MQTFDTLNDIEDWLESLTYEAFWEAVTPHAVHLPRKADCDGRITRGVMTEDQIFATLKHMAADQISERYNLIRQDKTPMLHG